MVEVVRTRRTGVDQRGGKGAELNSAETQLAPEVLGREDFVWNTALPPLGDSLVVAEHGTRAEAAEVLCHNAIAWLVHFVSRMPYSVLDDIGAVARRHLADEVVVVAVWTAAAEEVVGAQLVPLVSAVAAVALPYLRVQEIASGSLVSEQDLEGEEERGAVWLSVVELEVGDLLAGRSPEVLWRIHLVGWPGSPVCSTSMGNNQPFPVAHISNGSTHIPECSPANQVGVVDLALRIDMLARSHHHILSRRHIGQRRLSWVCVRDPY